VDTEAESPQESIAKIIAKLEELEYVPPALQERVYSEEEEKEIEDRLRALGYI
jgi:mannitol/fructose-specific phosphotransferase system IIA component (Ntr-type)